MYEDLSGTDEIGSLEKFDATASVRRDCRVDAGCRIGRARGVTTGYSSRRGRG